MWGTKTITRLLRPERPAPEQRRHNPDAVVDCAVYASGTRQPGAQHYAEAAKQARRHRNAFLWLGLHEPDRAMMTDVAKVFDLHELIVEQTVTGGHRPALETIGEVTRLVLRTARYVEHDELTANTEVVDTGDVTVLIGPWFVITVRNGGAGALWPVRQEMEKRPTVLKQGPWSIAYAVASRMVDEYLVVAAAVERDLERLEEETFTTQRTPEISHFYQLKREMVEFKRAVLPLQDPLTQLLDESTAPKTLRPYFVDIRGRLARAVDRVGAFDDLLNSILQARLTQVSLDQNNDMRMIAAWAAIAAVPTVIAGVYGMNFSHIPGLGSPYGFGVAIGAIVVICGGLYWRLRRSGWLR
jgi:magnesium transporter